jgi:O-glycosyl hydrolase
MVLSLRPRGTLRGVSYRAARRAFVDEHDGRPRLNEGSGRQAASSGLGYVRRVAPSFPPRLTCGRRRAAGRLSATLAVLLATLAVAPAAHAASTLTVDVTRPQQVIDGFGVNANVHSWHGGELRPAIDAIAAMGATTWRVIIDRADWEATNDNADPLSFNWDYYRSIYEQGKMADLWNTIAAIESKPGQLVMIDAMGGVPDWIGGSRIDADQEDEWVEMIASLVYYGRVDRHLRIDLLGPMNEPDWNGLEGPQVGPQQYVRVLHKLAVRLDELGLGSTKLVGPDTASASIAASSYYPAMTADPVVMDHVAAVGIHDYSGSVGGIDRAIAGSEFPSMKYWLTEFAAPCVGCDDGAPNAADWSSASEDVGLAFSYLDAGASGALAYDAWDGFYEHHNSMGYWGLLAYDADTGTYTPRKSYYALEQLMRYVPPGAHRIAADTSDGSPVDVEAFAHEPTGRLTVVLRNTASAPERVTGTLLGSRAVTMLATRYSDADANFESGADVAIDAQGRFTVDVPPDSVQTLTGTPGATEAPPPLATAPAASITAGPTGTTASSDASFAFTSDDVTAAYECSLDAQPWTACASPRAYPGLDAGDHTFAVRASNASGTGTPASRSWTVTALEPLPAPSPAPTPGGSTTLLGSGVIEGFLDAVDSGMAEAFPMTATATGPLPALRVYLDETSRATTLVAGLYADAGGHPGSRIAQGTDDSPRPGAWSTVNLIDASVSAGSRYWVAVLGSDGTLAFRDSSDGNCSSETSTSSSLKSLPSVWASGDRWSTCQISAYGAS